MDSKKVQPVSKSTLHRLPFYLQCLKDRAVRETHISAPVLAEDLLLNEVQVRKDLAAVSRNGGRPKTGYVIQQLIQEIELFLGYHEKRRAVIVGAGHLGKALICSKDLQDYGLKIEAAFDEDESLQNQWIDGVCVYAAHRIQEFCQERHVNVGIITVPAGAAQHVCDLLTESGVKAIWNFTPTHLHVPEGVALQNENMASSLAVLMHTLKEYNG